MDQSIAGKASLIILTYNNLDLTRQCLESIYAKTDEPEFEVILVDNASQDDTPQYLKGFAESHSNVKLILNSSNEGFARGNNLGAAAATGQYLVFLNNDIVVTKGWLAGLLRHLQNPAVGIVGPVTNSSGNKSRIRVDYQDLQDMDTFAEGYTRDHAGQSFEIDMLPFMCIALRREVFEEVGPLDEQFGLGMFEDDDYALRLKEKGYKCLCAEDVFVHHWGSASFSKLSTNLYWQTFKENLRRFEEKWGRPWQPQLYRPDLLHQQVRMMVDGAIWLSSQISDRDRLAASLQDVITERDQANKTLQDMIIERDQANKTLQDEITERNQIIRELQNAITGLQNAITERNQTNEVLWGQLIERDQQIAEIYGSRSWRLVRVLWRIRLAIVPPESLQERLLRWIASNLRNLKNADLGRHLVAGISKFLNYWLFRPLKILRDWLTPRPVKDFYFELRREYQYVDRSRVVLYADPSILPGYQPRQPIEAPADEDPCQLKVTLISTTLNEAASVNEWLASLLEQSRLPEEVVIADGGSTDGTPEIIREFASTAPFEIRVIEAPGANIAQGRNIAIRNARNAIIACSDCGCVLEKNWLRDLVYPFETDEKIQFSCGFYSVNTQDEYEQLYSHFFMLDIERQKPQEFLPSGRSIAMHKNFWARVGGYPEGLTDAGEDTLFDVQAKMHSAYWAFVPSAKVYWRAPRTAQKVIKTFFRYAKGDGESGVLASHYRLKIEKLLKVLTFGLLAIPVAVLAILFLRWYSLYLFVVILVFGVIQYLRGVRVVARLFNCRTRLAMNYSFVIRVISIVQVIGYIRGVLNRPNVRLRQVEQHLDQLDQILNRYPDRKGIILYPPTHDWGFMFQRPHQMARSFARQGYLYFYCTNNEKTDAVLGFQEVEPGLYLCHVPLEIFQTIERFIVYIGSPWHREWISRLGYPPFIYDHYDDLRVSSARLDDHEWLLQHADIVLVTSQLLLNSVRPRRPDAIFAPNGVDFEYIQSHRPLSEGDIPPDLKPILEKGGPIIGYSGALAEWFDYELLSHLAISKPDAQFVLLGTNYDGSLDRSRILEIQNVHWLGMKSFEELFNYVWRFDVGIIPFRVNEITLATSPIKLFEYMACENPVVSTALPECKRYETVFVAETYEEFSDHLDSALRAKLDPQYMTSLREVAQENTWDCRLDAIITRLVDLKNQERSSMNPSTNPPRKTAHSLRGMFKNLTREAVGPTELNSLESQVVSSGQEQNGSPSGTLPETPILDQAKALNDQLHSAIQAISPEDWIKFETDLRRYCDARGYLPDYTQNWVSHRFRLFLSLHWLESMINWQVSSLLALDLGGETLMTDLLRERFPHVTWQNTAFDLRYTWEMVDGSVDLIVCTELLEHLSDLPEGIGDTFYKTGLKAVLRESFRVLKPGGAIFITTPNAASVIQLEAILYGAAPWFYPLHVREYTPNELITELQEAGFLIKRWQTIHCLTIDYHKDYTNLFQMLLTFNHPTDNRGDDIFISAYKPDL